MFLLVILLLFNCKSFLYNKALEKIGAYDEKVKVEKLVNNKKEVVFIPMMHLSTELFYQDVIKKVDSLKKKGFEFYYEHTMADIKQDTILRKIRKIRGIPFSKDGYKESIDSILGDIKFKKKLVNQPSYEDLGLQPAFSKNVDATLKQMIEFYEDKYGEVVLDDCDFDTGIYEKTKCEDEKIERSILNDMTINFRNTIVVDEVLKDSYNKIAIIYGKGHFMGIKELLLKEGYK